MYAIVKSGGKQYRVERGQRLLVERLAAEEGADVSLEPLLYRSDDAVFDKDGLAQVKVTARVLAHVRGEKLRVFKFKPKRGYKRRTGHRQELTRIEVTDIAAAQGKARAAAKAPGAKRTQGEAAAAKARGAKPAQGEGAAAAKARGAKPSQGEGAAQDKARRAKPAQGEGAAGSRAQRASSAGAGQQSGKPAAGAAKAAAAQPADEPAKPARGGKRAPSKAGDAPHGGEKGSDDGS